MTETPEPTEPIILMPPSSDQLRTALEERFGLAAALIAQHEGMRTTAYADMTAQQVARGVAIGFGRNLTTNGISQAEALLLFYNDLTKHHAQLQDIEPYPTLDTVRRAVLLDMAHTLSANGLRRFKNTLAALKQENYLRAAIELGDSLWYDQQPRTRSSKLLTMMLSGEWPGDWVNSEDTQCQLFFEAGRGNYQAHLGKGNSKPVQILDVYQPQGPQLAPAPDKQPLRYSPPQTEPADPPPDDVA